VRTGAKSAWIEVELKSGSRTRVLRREFGIDRNTSVWRLDGAASLGVCLSVCVCLCVCLCGRLCVWLPVAACESPCV
jgi:hypothetical protein